MTLMTQDKTIVVNNQAQILQAQVALGEKGAEKHLIQLAPGANAVDTELWARAKKLKVVGIWLSTKASSVDSPQGSMMVAESLGLPALDAEGADKLLRATFDRKLLEQWERDESRVAIRQLVSARIAEMDRIKEQALAEVKAKSAVK